MSERGDARVSWFWGYRVSRLCLGGGSSRGGVAASFTFEKAVFCSSVLVLASRSCASAIQIYNFACTMGRDLTPPVEDEVFPDELVDDEVFVGYVRALDTRAIFERVRYLGAEVRAHPPQRPPVIQRLSQHVLQLLDGGSPARHFFKCFFCCVCVCATAYESLRLYCMQTVRRYLCADI